ncbi:MAG TPA: DNA polymerase I [Acidimicrobiales bacterium]|nr:DNA polymerase I [Acidimicrobiales bacterium]
MSERPAPGPLVLVDGMSLAYRAWFALPQDLATRDGVVTNAVHGFTRMLVYMVRDRRPSALAVAFDLPGPTFRDEMVEAYKAGRAETPDDLLPQFDMIRSVLEVLAIPVLGVPGYEADDVLATLATEGRDRGVDVVVVTGDRDCFQLVEDPHVAVLYNRRGVTDYDLYDEAAIVARFAVASRDYPMLAALRGDTSDHLPGVPGVGDKTAAKLLTTYGDLDGIFAHLGELSPKLAANLAASETLVRTNLEVMTLVRDVPLDVSVEQLTLGGYDVDAARARFDDLELKGAWRQRGVAALMREGAFGPPAPGSELPSAEEAGTSALGGPGVAEAPREAGDALALPILVTEVDVPLARPGDDAAAAAALGDLARAVGEAPLALAGRVARPGPTLRTLVLVAGDPPVAGVALDGALVVGRLTRAALGGLLAATPVVGHDVKEVLAALQVAGIDCRTLVMDSAVAAYLLDPSTGDYVLDAVADRSGHAEPVVFGQLALAEAGALDDVAAVADEAAAVAQVVAPLRRALEADGLAALHDAVETPLVRVLARMEVAGIAVDVGELRRIADELAGDTGALEAEIWRLAGHEFNVNSTPQLRTVLFDELGLTPGRKTKTGYSTDASTLESLRDAHPVVDTLLRYRELEKLRSTYGESLLAEVGADGRIHAVFRQTVARTGRLSSESPNLHNIPVRTEAGRRFRRAFVPAEGATFLVADYDQIELRVIAHLSGDPGLIEAFTTGADVHRTVAAGVFGVPRDEVTPAQRERAKMVSYGLAYGMEAYGLARRLSTGVDEASEIMDRYFGAFPEVRAYMQSTVAEARARGFTRTELGRKRPLPELADRNFRVRQAAERQAMNAGIQGLAADLFKTALLRLDAALEADGLASRLVLQVHDEVLVEVPGGEEEAVGPLTERALTGAAALSVPLEVSMAWGPSWAAAKGG